jgi:hypothetical protein
VDDDELNRGLDLMLTPRKWPPFARRVAEIHVLNLVDIQSFRGMPAHRIVLLMSRFQWSPNQPL